MENKINIAELLKDCPKGMELDCTMYEDVVFYDIVDRYYPIRVRRKQGGLINLNAYGCINDKIDSKCVIFPKGKTNWEGFISPCKFKDGDIVATNDGHWIGITKGGKNGVLIPTYCITHDGIFEVYLNKKETWRFYRLATEEEKQKLFQAIKDNGYKWNVETKTLEKLIEPKFKVGDRIRHKVTNKDDVYEISEVYDDSYGIVGFTWMLHMKYQDQYELVPNKFDITTLKPFESRVLVRDYDNQIWIPTFWGKYIKDGSDCYLTTNGCYRYCIPYNEETKHLIGTTNNCENFYKTWTES